MIGPKGCGKSVVVQQLADLLGYEVEPIMLYQANTYTTTDFEIDMIKNQLFPPGHDVSGPAAAEDDAAQRRHRLAILAPRHGRIGGQDGRA